MSRNTHDMELDHRGTADAERIASGTPTSGHVPVAAGAGVPAVWTAPSGGGGVTVQDEGTPLSTTATTLNFVGSGVAATGSGATKTITISGGGGGSLTYIVDGTLNAAPVAIMDGSDMLAADGSSGSTYAGVILPTSHDAVEIYAQTGSVFADIWADSTTGRVEFYSTNGMLFPTRASAPSSPAEAQAYYDTALDKLRIYDGSAWQDASGSGSSGVIANFSANKVRFEEDFDNFLTFFAGGVAQSQNGTGAASSAGVGLSAGPSHPGIVTMTCGTSASSRVALFGGEYFIAAGEVAFECVLAIRALSDGTNTWTLRVGLGSSETSEPSNGVYLRYIHSANSGKYLGVCRTGGTESTVDTGYAPTSYGVTGDVGTAMHRIGFVINAAGTSVQFYVNGSAAGAPVTANIPAVTNQMKILIGCIATAGSANTRGLYVDYYSLQYDFTTPR